MLLKKLKKLPALQLAVVLFTSAFTIVMGACPEDIIIAGKVPGILSPGEQEPGGQEPSGQEPGIQVPGEPEDSGPKTPTAEDYDIDNLNQLLNNISHVTITPKAGKSTGAITIFYNGSTLPSAVGTYAVTFDVEEAEGWNAATGLEAGDLIIGDPSLPTPTAADYTISENLTQTAGSVTPVTVTPKPDKSGGAVTVHYAGTEGTIYAKSEALPSEPGTYAVTFDVAGVTGWNPASTLHAGTLTIKGIPTAADFNIGNLNQTAGSVTAVTVTPKAGKSNGAITVKYSNSTTLPLTAGTYAVTFDVAASGVWNAAPGLVAGTLTINAADGGEETEINYATTLSWGTSFTPTTLGLTPGNTTAEVRLTWYRGSGTGSTPKVRFIRGTLIAGKQLIEVSGTAAGSSTTAQHKAVVTGLMPGESYVYAVSNDGINWSPMYNFKVPAASGAFKFAVISDPQLNLTTVDTDSRHPAINVTTAAAWKETMDILEIKGVSFIASGGDQVDTSSNEDQYTRFFAPDGLRSLPFAPVIGNHDTNILFFYHFNIPNEQGTANSTSAGANYYYRYNNILFVVLNTGGASPTSRSGATTYINSYKTTIQNAKAAHVGKYDWLIVQHHKSTASVGDHCADTDIQYYVEAGFETLMSEQEVDFVLAGHDHVYARSYPLKGMADGKVSTPVNTTKTNAYSNPNNPIYLTFTTASGIKYYAVSADPYFNYKKTLYNQYNASYPYLGANADGTSTSFGSSNYMNGNLPVSNLAFVQALIPSYTIVEVNGKTIKFSTYPIATKSGTSPGASQPYSFDANTPYDWVEVTKN